MVFGESVQNLKTYSEPYFKPILNLFVFYCAVARTLVLKISDILNGELCDLTKMETEKW